MTTTNPKDTKGETMDAYQLGRECGVESDHITKKERKAILAEAGLDICSVCDDFEAGRTAGIKERKEAERPEKEAREERNRKLREINDRIDAAIRRHEAKHRSEEMWQAAERMRHEALTGGEMPADVKALIEEKDALLA